MIIKLKTKKFWTSKKILAKNKIEEIDINEDIMHPEKESVKICFRGQKNSGIIEMSTEEAEELIKSIKGRIGLIKAVKKIKN